MPDDRIVRARAWRRLRLAWAMGLVFLVGLGLAVARAFWVRAERASQRAQLATQLSQHLLAASAVQRFLDQLRAGRPEIAYAMTTARFRTRVNAAAFSQLLADYPELGQPQETVDGAVHREDSHFVSIYRGRSVATRTPPTAWRMTLVTKDGNLQVDDFAVGPKDKILSPP